MNEVQFDKLITYTFYEVKSCNMCGASVDHFKVLGKRLNQKQGFRPQTRNGITTTVMQCKACGLVFSNPQPIPESINDHYKVDPNKYWKQEYFQTTESYFKDEIEWIKRLLPERQGLKSLDIGAGLGKQMISLARAGFDAYGIEPSQPFYEMAISKMAISKDKLQLSSIEDASFENEKFDFISFGAVLEHLYNPAESIKQAMKWLRKDGIMHIEVPNSKWLISRMLNLQYKLRNIDYVTNLSPMHNPYHLYEFSLESFRLNGLINGYEIADSRNYVCDTFMPKLIDPLFKAYMRKTRTGMQLCVMLRKI